MLPESNQFVAETEWYWVFFKEKTGRYFILKDVQVTGTVRWMLHIDGYEVLWDSARSYKQAAIEAKEHYNLRKLSYEIQPISFRDAKKFIDEHHRHHLSPQGHKFSISLHDGDIMIGALTAGRPVSRYQDDGFTLEITRCCVKEAYKNGISKLYSAACKTAQGMGYKRVITYILEEESGLSIRAANFKYERTSRGGSWNSASRKRQDKHPIGVKHLWTRQLDKE